MADDRLIIISASPRMLETVPASAAAFTDPVWPLVLEVEAWCAGTAKADTEVPREKGSVHIAEKPANITLNDVAGLCGRVAVSVAFEENLSCSVSGDPRKIVRASAELGQISNMILARNRMFLNTYAVKCVY